MPGEDAAEEEEEVGRENANWNHRICKILALPRDAR